MSAPDSRPRPSVRKGKTYSHLSHLSTTTREGAEVRRLPTEYEVVTSNLLYYPSRGFEVNTPLSAWYREYQKGSRLVCDDWERFCDPRATTYATYTELQRGREAFVDGILQSIENEEYDTTLDPSWRAFLQRGFAPLRFPLHGFQMLSAYVGQMAPTGRVTVAAAFQAADEMRRIQRIAYRMSQLQQIDPAFGIDSCQIWQSDPAWQPLRRAVELCLVTYDWAEALVALNLCIKPLIDHVFMVQLGKMGRARGDYLLGQVLASLEEDCRWHREWTIALLETTIAERESNRAVISSWVRKWAEVAGPAASAFEPWFDIDKELLTRTWSTLHRRLGIARVEVT